MDQKANPTTSRRWSGWAAPWPAWDGPPRPTPGSTRPSSSHPRRRDLRLALISQLVQDQKFAEAAKEYEALDQAEPNNPDTLETGAPWSSATPPSPARAKGRRGGHLAQDARRQAQRPRHHRPGRRPAPTGRADRTRPSSSTARRRTGTHQSPVSRIHRRIPP